MTNSEKLVLIRRALGWNQSQMAGSLNLDQSYLSMLETGSRDVSDVIVIQAREVLDEAARLARGRNIKELDQMLEEIDTEYLISLHDHVLKVKRSAPPHLSFLYESLDQKLVRTLALRIELEFLIAPIPVKKRRK